MVKEEGLRGFANVFASAPKKKNVNSRPALAIAAAEVFRTMETATTATTTASSSTSTVPPETTHPQHWNATQIAQVVLELEEHNAQKAHLNTLKTQIEVAMQRLIYDMIR